MKYDYTDIALSKDGDLIIDTSKDVRMARSVEALEQGINFRINTDLRDMFMHPGLGNKLKELVGKRNTREVAESGRADIVSCLTYGEFIDPNDLMVVALPIDSSNILYHVEIYNDTYVVYKFDLMCDLENGIRRI